jgi:uncharacterized protein YbdZ (MbtH family)
MAEQELEDSTSYRVVRNQEEQYSIWPEGRDCPPGWEEVGKGGTKVECLKYIEEVWTDMRPLSLRQKMQSLAESAGEPVVPREVREKDTRDDLVSYLSQGDHPVCATVGSVEQLLDSIRAGYVNLKFTDTRGGTELKAKLDSKSSDMTQGDFTQRKGAVHLVGDLILNRCPVRLTAEIALESLQGLGRLQARPSMS